MGKMNLLKKKIKRRLKNHINGIENFWGINKVKIYKFREMNKKKFTYILEDVDV